MFTFKSNTNLSPLTGTDLPLASLQHFLEAGSASRPDRTHWCELGAKLGTEQVVHKMSKAEACCCDVVEDWLGTKEHDRSCRKLCETISDHSGSIRNINTPTYS